MDAQQSPAVVDRPVYTPRIPHRAARCASGRLIGRLTCRCVVEQKCKEEEGYFLIMQTSSRPSLVSSSSFCVLHETSRKRNWWLVFYWVPIKVITSLFLHPENMEEQFVWFRVCNLKRFYDSSLFEPRQSAVKTFYKLSRFQFPLTGNQ